ncbi:hypothetical protein CQA62_04945 [Helicobacter cholecystus]|uniref:Calcineurin-like phosphoesterase domain-containing protein n=1 Tax=Helicobacter cholecystus TaxID=45498 RepID=A0A3D8IUI1_9HELI|nr:metallophosphoesterase [Helicobacter cholecystus]RDU68949.1 hypothetical protein CQA62_04945 [Helicobacter cholecystus]VEJ25966.1 metallophosphoesterase [Helicobacter cholecystus]
MCLKLNSDALFIADSHYNHQNSRDLLGYLHLLFDHPPSQIVLFGDIAQVLVGNLKSSLKANIELIDLLSSFEKTQMIWLEGNHDFALSALQKKGYLNNTTMIPRQCQPLLAEFEGKSYYLAHGDLFLGIGYELYARILRHSQEILWLIDWLSGGEIYEEFEEKLYSKAIRQENFHFFEFSARRIMAYQKYARKQGVKIDGIIEGHFHIGKKIEIKGIKYISLPAFYFTSRGNEIAKIIK